MKRSTIAGIAILMMSVFTSIPSEAAKPMDKAACEGQLRELFDIGSKKRLGLDPDARRKFRRLQRHVERACEKAKFDQADRRLQELRTFVDGYQEPSKEQLVARLKQHHSKRRAFEANEKRRRGLGHAVTLEDIAAGRASMTSQTECEGVFQSLIDEGRKRRIPVEVEEELSPLMTQAQSACESGKVKRAGATMRKIAKALVKHEARELHPKVQEAIARGKARKAAREKNK